MVSLIRIESEGKTLAEVVKDLEAARKQLGPFADKMHVHDEHYERVRDDFFRARRVLKAEPKSENSPMHYTFGASTTANTVVPNTQGSPKR